MASGDFRSTDLDGAVVRLASLMDGLAIQLALEDPDMTADRFTDLWWEAARLELGMTAD